MNSTPAAGAGPRTRGINWRRLDWPVVIGISGMHLGALAAFWPAFFSWSAVIAAVVIYFAVGALGITLCYHRLLTHRSFRTPKWFEYLLATIGCLAWQGGPVQWVGIHRLHHKYSDDELDPHSPTHGFTWSHMLWCMHKDDHGMRGVDAAKDLLRDPGLNLINKYFYIPQFLLVPVIFAMGWGLYAAAGIGAAGTTLGVSNAGLSWLVWAVCVRVVALYHATWFVNSASHTWGYRNYETKDRSTNNWWVALLGFGEGWHNNHHAHQRSAAHGLRWFELDMSYLLIRALGLVGLASDIVLPEPDKLPGRGAPASVASDAATEPTDASTPDPEPKPAGRSPRPTPAAASQPPFTVPKPFTRPSP